MPLSFPIGRVLGIPIRVHASWFVVFALMVYGLVVGPLAGAARPLLAVGAAMVVALLLFASVTLHELGHSAVALSLGINVRSITLFLFGGVAEIVGEPRRVRDEIAIALAGPAVSFLLALAIVPFAGEDGLLPRMCELLALANFSVGALNLLPALPLDGGRVLRAVLWGLLGDYRRATTVAAGSGLLLAGGVIALGLLSLAAPLSGARGGGLWFVLIGLFLGRSAVRAHSLGKAHALLRQGRVGEVAVRLPPGVPPPPADGLPSIDIDASLEEAATLLAGSGAPRALVFHGRDLVGEISRAEIARWLLR